ncbi:hypothetical protein AX774_g464 [Zancudomyces culisetae]|uniref:Uncharacterized protein n=1 Tax=Zancudomyces culisetae TaxID=1213189 RepID=A0A1R1PYH3_ZANCU|nr:hypothetical protein AX774_g464 [Zancudomyces culisetae]|eukprot:OMH86000.1 hypothetical protein AX774_g464 [Zancudomyces culisetae]
MGKKKTKARAKTDSINPSTKASNVLELSQHSDNGSVLVVDATNLSTSKPNSSSTVNKYEKKSFMSHKIAKVTGDFDAGSSKKSNKKEDDVDEQNDKELFKLINDTNLIESLSKFLLFSLFNWTFKSYQALINIAIALNPDLDVNNMSGKERLKLQQRKLASLGLIGSDPTPKAPTNIYFGMQNKRIKRAKAEVTDFQNRGIFSKSVKSQIYEKHHVSKSLGANKNSRVNRLNPNRGLKASVGKFKNGILYVDTTFSLLIKKPLPHSLNEETLLSITTLN